MQDQVCRVPKVELHSHLEGTIKPALALEIAKRNSVLLDTNLFHENGSYAWSDFSSFLTAYDSVSSCLRSGKDYRDITYEYLKDCASENVIYAETFISPDHAAECGISYDDMISGIAKGIDDAQRDFEIIGRIIVTCVRHLGPEQGLNIVQNMVNKPHPYIVGFGMGGDENAFTLEEFAPVFNIADEAGYPCTVHAGEICGSESVWDAMHYLPIKRIGHGVNSIEDETLLDFLSKDWRNIHLEICPGSNVSLGVYKNYSEHPFPYLRNCGCKVTLNSDDPPFFHTNIGKEYKNAHTNFGLSIDNLLDITRTAINAAFIKDDEKKRLQAKVDSWKKSG
mgnify:CR=1 FL=1